MFYTRTPLPGIKLLVLPRKMNDIKTFAYEINYGLEKISGLMV
jgi:hypothetical protein